MKKLTIITFFLIQIMIMKGQTDTLTNYIINTDTVWSSDTIRILDNVVVGDTATLTILNGTHIEFQGHYKIEVYGIFKALGQKYDSVYFTINDTTSFNDTTTVNGGWGGIRFMQCENIDTSFFQYCSLNYGKAVLPNNPFEEQNNGGSIYAKGYSNIVIKNSSFRNNRSNYLGAATAFRFCNYIEISECDFINNYTYYCGGGVFIKDTEYFSICHNLFYKNTAHRLIGNTAESGSGSGIHISQLRIHAGVIESNKFYNNKSLNGAIYESADVIKVINNIIANNYGVGLGEGIQYAQNAVFANNTIVNNWGYIVPALWFNSTFTKMINNIVWGNGSAPFFGYQILSSDIGWIARITYSCIQDGYPGEGNTQKDPEFVNPTQGYGLEYDALNSDWSLVDNSPCVNFGKPDTTGYYLPEYDIDGNPRIYGYRIDMGAIENQQVVSLPENILRNTDYIIGPNPVNDKLAIHLRENANINKIIIFNQTGEVVYSILNIEEMALYTIDFSKYSTGLYFVHIENTNGTVVIEKILKL